MICNRGDVVLVDFPDSNLVTWKRRPALVVQADGLSTGLPQTIVAMITTNTARSGHQSRIDIDPLSPEGRNSGLRTRSIVMTDNLVTIENQYLRRTLGSLAGWLPVDDALRYTLGL